MRIFQRRIFDVSPLGLGLGHFVAYAAGCLLTQLVAITLITYFSSLTHSRFQEISDTYASAEIPLRGGFALLYLLILKWLHPLSSTTREELITLHRVEKRWLPGFGSGLVLALALTGAFVLSGQYDFLGLFTAWDEAPLTLGGMLVRALSIILLAYAEEFIFRSRILNAFSQILPLWGASVLTAILYCTVKMIQFDLGWMDLLTFFIFSLASSIRALKDGDFMRSAGWAAGIWAAFHVLFSLPIFGIEFQGILIVRYSDQTGTLAGPMARFLTGGIGGPLSSFGLQVLFLIDFCQGALRHRKLWLSTKS